MNEVLTASPTHDEIARRAYNIYVNKGSQKGQCQMNWHQAERELRKPAVRAGSGEYIATPPATLIPSKPMAQAFADSAPLGMDGRGSRRSSSALISQGGQNNKV